MSTEPTEPWNFNRMEVFSPDPPFILVCGQFCPERWRGQMAWTVMFTDRNRLRWERGGTRPEHINIFSWVYLSSYVRRTYVYIIKCMWHNLRCFCLLILLEFKMMMYGGADRPNDIIIYHVHAFMHTHILTCFLLHAIPPLRCSIPFSRHGVWL